MSDNSEELLKQLIRSTNRTTHAVRAFVRFLLIQLSAITLAVLIFNAGNLFQDSTNCSYGICPANEVTAFLAGLIWIIGVVWSSIAGWSELAESDVPATSFSARTSPATANPGESMSRAAAPAKPVTDGVTKSCASCGTEVKPGWNVCVNCRTWVERE